MIILTPKVHLCFLKFISINVLLGGSLLCIEKQNSSDCAESA